jgi:hypothetical protein
MKFRHEDETCASGNTRVSIYHKRRYSQSLARLPRLGLPAALGRFLPLDNGSFGGR